MMNVKVAEHDYISASTKIDSAIKVFHAEPQSDRAFQELVITLVDEACGGCKLYSPEDADRKDPIAYRFNGTNVYALYTDKELADACALGCYEMLCGGFPKGTEVSLEDMINRGGGTCALALNMGLPSQIILPPDVVHTIRHLMIAHSLHTREPEGSSWNEWIGIMEKYFDERNTNADTDRGKQSIHCGNIEMHLPVRRSQALFPSGSLPEYYIDPSA